MPDHAVPQVQFSPTRLRERRDAAGLSRMKLAVATGYGYETVVSWEREERVPRGNALMALAVVLGCAVEDFFEPLTENDPAGGARSSRLSKVDQGGSRRVES